MVKYDFLKDNNQNKFYPVKVEEINELEKELELNVPKELKDFLLEIGYGFINGLEGNVNRIMDTDSIRDFRLRKGDFEFYTDIEIYDEYEEGKLIFFEGRESALISIGLTDNSINNIFYYDIKIENSLDEFFMRIQEDDNYYLEILD
ncbi:SMI1/KNR4 family protein [Clostridium polynesiense]|uniref:SMI1/KNR4 family protein n=1 Tax=Clostridium polynesiense TaxID=1325933 RepID=UPI00058F0622|nr:SMI1/KNR4 family protein [Clostridium polynesiense]